jgi:carbamoyltransferase
MPKLILGLNAFHADSAASIVVDGRLVAAAEEERFTRVKHWSGFPTEAIAYCLREARVSISDVDLIAINQDSSANAAAKIRYGLGRVLHPALLLERLRVRKKRDSIADYFARHFAGADVTAKVTPIEHHEAHLYSAYFVSPFPDAAALSVDGFGDFCSTVTAVGQGDDLSIHQRVYFPHSLGVLYQALTQYLGFPNYGDEYKVMGLAPYGNPVYLEKLRQLITLKADGRFELNLKYFRHHREKIAMQWENGSPEFSDLYADAMEDLLGPRRQRSDPLEQRHKDLARSVQALYEEAFFNIVHATERLTDSKNIVLAGGCANNSVANGKIRRQSRYQHVYVHAAPGDAGGAIGAAFAAWHKSGGQRRFVMDHAYWGPSFSDEEIKTVLESNAERIAAAGCTIEHLTDESDLYARAAQAIAEGKVVGWFQGRMEWGPRALGNRSILGDPRRPDMKDILNAKIKRRESFRPFAPSVLAEHVADWFEEDDAVPFMMQVFQVREERRPGLPAITHVDGSGRLQSVYARTNPRYHALIEAVERNTGTPMVLNTSFNENEPVVCRPQEALDCFLRTNMDLLVLEQYVVSRQ